MALFKILRGNESTLSDQDYHDGYAYFTKDTGNFYIDAVGENGDISRIQLNANQATKDRLNRFIYMPSTISIELLTDNWVATSSSTEDYPIYHQQIEIESNLIDLGTSFEINLYPDKETLASLSQCNVDNLFIENDEGVIYAVCTGDKPLNDLNVRASINVYYE